MSEITIEELLAEMERIDEGQADGVTVAELVAKTGRSPESIRRHLAAINQEGRLTVGTKAIRRLDGQWAKVPCYKVAPKSPPPTKRRKRR